MACVSCEDKDAEIRRLSKLIAELTFEIEELKAGQAVNPNEEKLVFELIAPPLNNAHWGQEDQAEISTALVAQLSHFTRLLRFGKFFEFRMN